ASANFGVVVFKLYVHPGYSLLDRELADAIVELISNVCRPVQGKRYAGRMVKAGGETNIFATDCFDLTRRQQDADGIVVRVGDKDATELVDRYAAWLVKGRVIPFAIGESWPIASSD